MKQELTKNGHALVVLSGGQDSVTCLGYALRFCKKVSAISFIYGQRHAIELQYARELCVKYNVEQKIVDLSFMASLVTSALTGQGSVNDPHPNKPGLPASFVPNRNALFLTVAHAHAQEIKADTVLIGTCQTDYSGYPDCRSEFISRMNHALNTGSETDIRIATPLMNITKGDTFALAADVGFLDEVINMSHTCYNGDHETKHEHGFGCGHCPACQLREKGFAEYKEIIDFRKGAGAK